MIKLEGDTTEIDGSYQISSDFIKKYSTEGGLILYDIKLQVQDPLLDYYFDIETKSEFLTSDINV